MQRNLLGILLAAACGVLLACHHSGGAALVKRHATVAAGASTADQGPTDLVAAVSVGGSAVGAVSLKFQLRQRPLAGQPVDLVLRLVANQPLEHLEARFHAEDGLDIPQGSDFDPLGPVDTGAAIDHRLTVVAAHEGVYTVLATVTSGTAVEAVSHSFVIPIVFGPAATAGPPGAAAAKSP